MPMISRDKVSVVVAVKWIAITKDRDSQKTNVYQMSNETDELFLTENHIQQ